MEHPECQSVQDLITPVLQSVALERFAATMIKSSRAAICSLSSTPAARRTPLPHLCAHLTPCTTIVIGANAMHHLPDKDSDNNLNPGFVTHACESLLERTLLSATGPVDISPIVHEQ